MGKISERIKRRRKEKKAHLANGESPEEGSVGAQGGEAAGRALLLEGMRATLVAAAGPGGALEPGYARCMLGAASARVAASEPAFRSERWAGVVLSVAEWPPLRAYPNTPNTGMRNKHSSASTNVRQTELRCLIHSSDLIYPGV